MITQPSLVLVQVPVVDGEAAPLDGQRDAPVAGGGRAPDVVRHAVHHVRQGVPPLPMREICFLNKLFPKELIHPHPFRDSPVLAFFFLLDEFAAKLEIYHSFCYSYEI